MPYFCTNLLTFDCEPPACFYFFAGEAAGEALASGEGLVDAAPSFGLSAGLADAAGDASRLALGAGAAAGFDAGCGVADGEPSPTTDPDPKPGSENNNARNIKIAAAMIVAFSSGFCAPRGPNAVWLPAPPNAAATSPPFPDCKRMTRIRKTQTKTKITLNNMSKANYLP
jgi:hypothetical protein